MNRGSRRDPDFDPEKCESAYALWAVKEEGEPVNPRGEHHGQPGLSVRILVFLENHIVQRGDRQAPSRANGGGWRYLPCRLCRGYGAPRRRRLRWVQGELDDGIPFDWEVRRPDDCAKTRAAEAIRAGDPGAAPERIRVDRGNTLTL